MNGPRRLAALLFAWVLSPALAASCDLAREALDGAGAARMVIGHTVQYGGINSVCGGRVWRIDTGMSSYYQDGPVELLELTPRGARVLTLDRLKL